MKFIDPLAAMQHMGGAPPIHLAMAMYSIYIHFYSVDKLVCHKRDSQGRWTVPDDEMTALAREEFKDVKGMFIAHAGAVSLYFMSKLFHRLNGGHFKVILLNASIFLYMMSILYLLYSYLLTRDGFKDGDNSRIMDPRVHCLTKEGNGNV